MEGIMKIVKFVAVSGLLIKWNTETIENEEKGGFLSILLCLLSASFWRNLLDGKYEKVERRGKE